MEMKDGPAMEDNERLQITPMRAHTRARAQRNGPDALSALKWEVVCGIKIRTQGCCRGTQAGRGCRSA